MHITAASYAEALKNIQPSGSDSLLSILKKLPNPIPVDEIKIIEPESKAAQKKKPQQTPSQPIDWLKVLWAIVFIIASAAIIVFALPFCIMLYYKATAKAAKEPKDKAFKTYRATMYYLNQLGYFRTNMGPNQYAQFIDKHFETGFHNFSNLYQKIKYGNMPLTADDTKLLHSFYSSFLQQIKNQLTFKNEMQQVSKRL